MPPKERPLFILDQACKTPPLKLKERHKSDNLSSFEEFQKWAGTLGIWKGWVKE